MSLYHRDMAWATATIYKPSLFSSTTGQWQVFLITFAHLEALFINMTVTTTGRSDVVD